MYVLLLVFRDFFELCLFRFSGLITPFMTGGDRSTQRRLVTKNIQHYTTVLCKTRVRASACVRAWVGVRAGRWVAWCVCVSVSQTHTYTYPIFDPALAYTNNVRAVLFSL